MNNCNKHLSLSHNNNPQNMLYDDIRVNAHLLV